MALSVAIKSTFSIESASNIWNLISLSTGAPPIKLKSEIFKVPLESDFRLSIMNVSPTLCLASKSTVTLFKSFTIEVPILEVSSTPFITCNEELLSIVRLATVKSLVAEPRNRLELFLI